PLAGNWLQEPPTDPTVPERADEQVRAAALAWLDRYARWIWPEVAGSEGFDWEALYSLLPQPGERRLDAQWLRANVAPTERCVLSPCRRNRFRLPPDGSGFSNLVLAGDWTRNAVGT